MTATKQKTTQQGKQEGEKRVLRLEGEAEIAMLNLMGLMGIMRCHIKFAFEGEPTKGSLFPLVGNWIHAADTTIVNFTHLFILYLICMQIIMDAQKHWKGLLVGPN